MQENYSQHSYLQNEQYYRDLYDLYTIEKCLNYCESLYKKLNKENKKDVARAVSIVVYAIKVTRFKEKNGTVSKWMAQDQLRQSKFDTAEESEIYCPKCGILLEVLSRNLHERSTEQLKVLFIYGCPKCGLRKGIFDTGEAFLPKAPICTKCGNEIGLDVKFSKNGNITKWIYKCASCGYSKVDIDDHRSWEIEREKEKKRKEQLLSNYREKFCFSEKEGNERGNHLYKSVGRDD